MNYFFLNGRQRIVVRWPQAVSLQRQAVENQLITILKALLRDCGKDDACLEATKYSNLLLDSIMLRNNLVNLDPKN